MLLSVYGALYAQDMESVLRGLLDNKTFEKNRSFIIGGLFRNPQLYRNEYGIDYPKILIRLKENGLLKLSTSSPRAFRIHIEAHDTPIFVTRSVQNALKSLGYYYATPIQAEFIDGYFHLVMLMNAESALDPVSFILELEKYGYRISSIKRTNDITWRYVLVLKYPKIPEAIPLEYDIEVAQGSLKGEYWYATSRQKGVFAFSSLDSRIIYPEVAMYDAALQLISIEKPKQNSDGEYRVTIPSKVVFLRLSDQYTPSNIKTGIRAVLRQ